MPGKSLTPTVETVTAMMNFSDWLKRSMEESDTTCEELADYVGVERKTVLAWLNTWRPPKLDQLVRIYKYFGHSWVMVPFGKLTELPTTSGGIR